MSLLLPAYSPLAYEKNLHAMLQQFHAREMELVFIASNHALTRHVLQQKELEAHLKNVQFLHATNATQFLHALRQLELPVNQAKNKSSKQCSVIVSPYSQLIEYMQGYEQEQYVQNVEKLLDRLEKQGMMVVKVEN